MIFLGLAAGTPLTPNLEEKLSARTQIAFNFPSLSYPTKSGRWGCHFTRSCKTPAPGKT